MSTATLPTPAPLAIPEYALTEEVYGVIVEKPVSAVSILIANLLHVNLGSFVQQHGIGWCVVECMFVLDRAAKLRRRPDIAFVSTSRWPLDKPFSPTDDWDVIPDLAIEVVSPSNRMEEMTGKVGEYFRHGCKEVWLILPKDKQVYVYSSQDHIRIVSELGVLETLLVPNWKAPASILFSFRLNDQMQM